MAAKVLKARDCGDSYYVEIHLDTAHTVSDDGGVQVPDPEWIVSYTFGRVPPAGMSAAQWLASIRTEVRAYVADELSRRSVDPGTALAFEGQAP